MSTNQKIGFIEMEGKEVFKHAVEKLSFSEEALIAANKKIDDLDHLVPHQANQRIILAVADRLKIDLIRLFQLLKIMVIHLQLYSSSFRKCH